jgi:hypothetical protein
VDPPAAWSVGDVLPLENELLAPAQPCGATPSHHHTESATLEVLRLAVSAAFLSSNLSDRLGHVLRADLRIALYHAQAGPSAELHQCAQIDAGHH